MIVISRGLVSGEITLNVLFNNLAVSAMPTLSALAGMPCKGIPAGNVPVLKSDLIPLTYPRLVIHEAFMFSRLRISLLVALVCCSAFGAPLISEICVLPGHAAAEQSVSKTVSVLGKVLELKDTQGGKSGQAFIAEYIPAGETFDNFTVMFASRFTPGAALDPMVSAQSTAKRIQDRQQAIQSPTQRFSKLRITNRLLSIS